MLSTPSINNSHSALLKKEHHIRDFKPGPTCIHIYYFARLVWAPSYVLSSRVSPTVWKSFASGAEVVITTAMTAAHVLPGETPGAAQMLGVAVVTVALYHVTSDDTLHLQVRAVTASGSAAGSPACSPACSPAKSPMKAAADFFNKRKGGGGGGGGGGRGGGGGSRSVQPSPLTSPIKPMKRVASAAAMPMFWGGKDQDLLSPSWELIHARAVRGSRFNHRWSRVCRVARRAAGGCVCSRAVFESITGLMMMIAVFIFIRSDSSLLVVEDGSGTTSEHVEGHHLDHTRGGAGERRTTRRRGGSAFDHITIGVPNITAANLFYQQCMRLKPRDSRPDINYVGVWYELEHIHLHVVQTELFVPDSSRQGSMVRKRLQPADSRTRKMTPGGAFFEEKSHIHGLHLALRLPRVKELQSMWTRLRGGGARSPGACSALGGEVLNAEIHIRSDGAQQFWVRDPGGLVWEVMTDLEEEGGSPASHSSTYSSEAPSPRVKRGIDAHDRNNREGDVTDVRERLRLVAGDSDEDTSTSDTSSTNSTTRKSSRPQSTPAGRRSWAVAAGNPIVTDAAEQVLRAGGGVVARFITSHTHSCEALVTICL